MNNKFPILAIETSGDLCSVAVMIDENTFAETSINQKHVHSEKLMSLIESTTESVDLKLKDIGHIAISTGPGSFTGLRIGMAAVKGLAFGASLPVVPVPAFEALALKICSYIDDKTSFIIANSVNISELYYAKFKKEKGSYKFVEELSLVKKEDLLKMIGQNELVFGNFHDFNPVKSVSLPNAHDIAKWSYFFGEDLLTFEYDYVEPNYLKNFDIKVKR